MNTQLLRSVLCTLTLSALLPVWSPTAQAQIAWDTSPANPVLDYQASGWDAGLLFEPHVIQVGDTLKMWYAGRETGPPGPGLAVGYAWSLDGITWTRHPDNPVFLGEDLGVTDPVVLFDGDTYRMWYGAIIGAESFDIGYATSPDGITWAPNAGPVLEPSDVGDWVESVLWPGDVIEEDGLFKMWFSGGVGPIGPSSSETAVSVGYATSPDGVTWTVYDDPATTEAPFDQSDPVLRHGGPGTFDHLMAWTPSVLRTDDGGYEMWYAGNETSGPDQAIGYATSPDGIAWTKHAGNPVLTPPSDPSSWAWEFLMPSVLRDGDQYHMWFAGIDPSPTGNDRIGYATASVTVDAEPSAGQPEALSLRAPYPNPTAAGTTLGYRLSETAHVTLAVHDLLSREVARLVDGVRRAGEHAARWDGRNANGQRLAAGVYLVRLHAGDAMQSRKVVLLR